MPLPGNLPATGSRSLTIVGAGLSSASYSGQIRAAPTAAEATNWISDSAVRGLGAAGVKYTHRVRVTLLQV